MRKSPRTLHDVGAMVAAGQPYPLCMKEFIDHLIREALAAGGVRDGLVPIPPEAFRDEPPPLETPLLRAHLGGMAEHLARLSAQSPPSWCARAPYFLPEPVRFGGSLARDLVIAATPPEFRRRNLYCGRVLAKLHATLRTGCA